MSPAGRFLRRLPVAALAALLLWLLLRPVLDRGVCGLAQVLMRAFERPRTTRLVAVDHRAEVRRSDLRSDSAVPVIALTGIHASTVVLLALFGALARPLSREQLRRLVIGWALLVVGQSVNLVLHVKLLYAAGFGEWSAQHYSELARTLSGYLRHAADLPVRFALPFVLWTWLSWDQVSAIAGLRDDAVRANGSPRSSSRRAAPRRRVQRADGSGFRVPGCSRPRARRRTVACQWP